jgi:hypothetical protein
MKLKNMKNICAKLTILAGLLTVFSAGAATSITNEFWISPYATGNFYTNGFGGTIDGPLDGSSQANFDYNLNSLPANSTIHILAGTYQTHGVEIKSYQKIVGSGIDVTILQFPAGYYVGGSGPAVVYTGPAVTNAEVCDLTCDCNILNNSDTYNGIEINGTENAVRRVKVIHCGTYGSTDHEAWGIQLENYNFPDSVGNIIEECEVSQYTGGAGDLFAISMPGPMSGIICNNRIFATQDKVVFGLGCSGHDFLIEGNYVQGADLAFHSEVPIGWTNVTIIDNTFNGCGEGADLHAGANNLTFAFNTIELTNEAWAANATFAFWFSGDQSASYTNLFIFGNNISFNGVDDGPWNILIKQDGIVSGLVFANNTVDPILTNDFLAYYSNLSMYNNTDGSGNYLSNLNIPTIGGVEVTSVGLSLVGSTTTSSALMNLGLPSNPAVIVTNGSVNTVTFDTNVVVNGSIYMPVSTGSSGVIYSGSNPMLIASSNQNFFLGQNAGNFTVTNFGDTAVGSHAENIVAGGANSAFGYYAMGIGYTTGQYNSAFGANSLQSLGSGSFNTGVGTLTLLSATTESYSTAVGCQVLQNITSGDGNTGVGAFSAGNLINNGGLSPNTAIGAFSFNSLISGGNDIAVGYNAGSVPTNGNNNIYIGNIGTQGDNDVIRIGTPGTQTNAYFAGAVTATTFNGSGSALAGITASQVGADASGAAQQATNGFGNIVRYSTSEFAAATNATIWNSLSVNGVLNYPNMVAQVVGGNGMATSTLNTSTGTVVTVSAGVFTNVIDFTSQGNGNNAYLTYTNMIGGNVNLGFGSSLNIQGGDNTAFGWQALASSQSGSGANVAFGNYTLQSLTTGSLNVAVGEFALKSETNGIQNVAVGLDSLNASTASWNTAVGCFSLDLDTSGYFNVAVGAAAIQSNLTGSENVSIGCSSGYSVNSSGNILIGSGADVPLPDIGNQMNIGGIIFGNGLNSSAGNIGLFTTNLTGANFTVNGTTLLNSNVTVAGTIAASNFSGNGAGLTNLSYSTRPLLFAVLTNSLTISNNIDQRIWFNSNLSSNNVSYSTNTGFTIGTSGVYEVNATVVWQGVNGSAAGILNLVKNGVDYLRVQSNPSQNNSLTLSAAIPLAVGDTVDFNVWQNSSSTVVIGGNAAPVYQTYLSFRLIQ